ncbi:odorant receptor 83a-like [Diabrotica undecimpunctata]|uniref:odorant receptor 83a-like n=1 Tax=Diabrotica undecimpunctata TaxID=50387 RepID=UPI003B63C9FD
MCMVMLVFMGMYKTVILWYKSDELKSVFHIILTDFWPYDLINLESKRKIKDMYRLMNGLIWWFFCAGFLYASMFLIPSLFSTRGLPYIISYPFDWTVSPWYEIIYCTQGFAHGITITFIGTGANFLVLGTLLNISSQYCILQECFEIFNTPEMYSANKKLRKIMNDGLENKYTDERKEYFVRCVRHHQLILRFTKQLNNAMNPLELYQLAVSIFALCLGALRIANMESLGSVAEQAVSFIYLIGFTMQLFIDCFFGTYLYHQASLLPDAIFHSKWRTLEDEELRKDFVFLLQNSQRIPQFNAYNVYDMHMVSFIKVSMLVKNNKISNLKKAMRITFISIISFGDTDLVEPQPSSTL